MKNYPEFFFGTEVSFSHSHLRYWCFHFIDFSFLSTELFCHYQSFFIKAYTFPFMAAKGLRISQCTYLNLTTFSTPFMVYKTNNVWITDIPFSTPEWRSVLDSCQFTLHWTFALIWSLIYRDIKSLQFYSEKALLTPPFQIRTLHVFLEFCTTSFKHMKNFSLHRFSP